MTTTTLDIQSIKGVYEQQLQDMYEAGGTRTHSGSVFQAMLEASRLLAPQHLEPSAGNVWLWSDLHLGHERIIKYADRPFSNAADMDATMYRFWDTTVDGEDILIFVGDVAMGNALREETWQRIRNGPGHLKHLIFGNHDLTGSGDLRVDGFDHVSSVMGIDGDPPLILTHMPLTKVPAGFINVHGHTHNTPPGQSPHINVSVEQLDYTPLSLERIRILATELILGHYPAGNTTLERILTLEESLA